MHTSDFSRYPHKEEYGSTAIRCGWCGKMLPHHVYETGGNYCSFDCYAAGRYEYNIAMGVFMLILVVAFTSITIQEAIQNPNPFLSSWPFSAALVVIFGIIALYLIATVRHGKRIRVADEMSRTKEHLIESSEDLEQIHQEILTFVSEIPANEGITRKHIIDHLATRGFDTQECKVAIHELVGSGYLEEITIGRYIIGIHDQSPS